MAKWKNRIVDAELEKGHLLIMLNQVDIKTYSKLSTQDLSDILSYIRNNSITRVTFVNTGFSLGKSQKGLSFDEFIQQLVMNTNAVTELNFERDSYLDCKLTDKHIESLKITGIPEKIETIKKLASMIEHNKFLTSLELDHTDDVYSYLVTEAAIDKNESLKKIILSYTAMPSFFNLPGNLKFNNEDLMIEFEYKKVISAKSFKSHKESYDNFFNKSADSESMNSNTTVISYETLGIPDIGKISELCRNSFTANMNPLNKNSGTKEERSDSEDEVEPPSKKLCMTPNKS